MLMYLQLQNVKVYVLCFYVNVLSLEPRASLYSAVNLLDLNANRIVEYEFNSLTEFINIIVMKSGSLMDVWIRMEDGVFLLLILFFLVSGTYGYSIANCNLPHAPCYLNTSKLCNYQSDRYFMYTFVVLVYTTRQNLVQYYIFLVSFLCDVWV